MKKVLFSFFWVALAFPLFAQNSITVITPNGGENWIMGCPYTIQWVTTSPMPVKIELYNNNAFCLTICSQVPVNQNSYTWTPPSYLTPGNIYKVKVSGLTNTAAFDFSNAPFSITTGTITVVAPNGGEIWQKGMTYQILWTDNLCDNVRIELWKGGIYHSVICNFYPSSGSYSWTIPNINTIVPGNDYKIKILKYQPSSSTGNAVFDFSNANFTITQGYFITVTAPNGGEIWTRGSTRIITWTDNIPWNVRIELWKGGTFHSLICNSAPSNGTYYWAISSTQPLGNDYKVKIMALSTNTALFDFSNYNFTIAGMVKPSLSTVPSDEIIIYPNPCNNLLKVRLKDDNFSSVSVGIMNLTGQITLQQNFQGSPGPEEIEINTAALPDGYYIIVIKQDNNIVFRNSVIIRH